MRIFKTKLFTKRAAKEGVTDKILINAVNEMEQGLVDANLGGHVYKKRVALKGRGKSGSARTLLAYQVADKAFFIYGFMKNEKENLSGKELKALKLLAEGLLSYSHQKLQEAINDGELKEVKYHE